MYLFILYIFSYEVNDRLALNITRNMLKVISYKIGCKLIKDEHILDAFKEKKAKEGLPSNINYDVMINNINFKIDTTRNFKGWIDRIYYTLKKQNRFFYKRWLCEESVIKVFRLAKTSEAHNIQMALKLDLPSAKKMFEWNKFKN